jgi:hypothetical protein
MSCGVNTRGEMSHRFNCKYWTRRKINLGSNALAYFSGASVTENGKVFMTFDAGHQNDSGNTPSRSEQVDPALVPYSQQSIFFVTYESAQ